MNATLKKLQKLLNSRTPPKPKVICFDTMHVRSMTVVEGGTFEQMKRCLLNLPNLLVPLMGTYITSGWDRPVADVVIPLMGTVSNANVYLDTEMTVLKNREVRGRNANVIVLDDANFRLEV